MNKMIAVETNLTPIMEFLSEKGYQVETIDFSSEYSKNIDKYDALVVTGMNTNFLGVEDTISKIPVINAKGLTKEEVFDQVSSKVKQ